jgi:hypothetical protein
MSATDGNRGRSGVDHPAEFRYGVVFLLTLVLVVFEIVAPEADWSLAVALVLEGAALLVVIATSRARRGVRRTRTLVAGTGVALLTIGVASGVLPIEVTLALNGLWAAAIPLALAGGLVRLVRSRGVTFQAVAGALAIYLLLGLMFAWVIGFVSEIDSAAYFTQGTSVTDGDRVYYSFTVLTTTGFGDYTAAKPVGHALAVVEMLVGQLYLVTVIGILIGSIAGRQRS